MSHHYDPIQSIDVPVGEDAEMYLQHSIMELLFKSVISESTPKLWTIIIGMADSPHISIFDNKGAANKFYNQLVDKDKRIKNFIKMKEIPLPEYLLDVLDETKRKIKGD